MQMFKTEPNNHAHYRRLGERETDLHIMRQQINTRSCNGQYHYQHTKMVTLKTHLLLAVLLLLYYCVLFLIYLIT